MSSSCADRPAGAAAPGPQLNRAERLRAAVERDGPTCVWCSRVFDELIRPTTEHLVPRVKGGPSWLENEVAACRRCNSQRGHEGPAAWLQECRGRGWAPDTERVVRMLWQLSGAIEERGGQRRVRPYLAHQLRRLGQPNNGKRSARAPSSRRSSSPSF